MVKVGDKVRFLNSVGGGIVRSIKGKIVSVEEEDGFEIPVLCNECVVIEPAAPQEEAALPPAEEKEEIPEKKEEPHPIEEKALDSSLLEKELREKEEPPHAPKQTSHKPSKEGPIEVDLHIYELVDSTTGLSHTDMLQLQLKAFRDTLEQYKEKKGQKIVFIHGKGAGVLRRAILEELQRKYKTYDHQDASFQEYGFGATQVTIR
ncbi:MAG: Smr/MutS family protein [Porphyromonadaceae bacterium]|nr:Smr/MutS family protein [Porphyromonadaceae bacterium]